MTTQEMKIKLIDAEINQAKREADKYLALINKELSYTDLCDLENIAYYSKAYKMQMELVNNGYVII